jgi:pimeloyl-ACP methyl ester carboxylesterase
VNVLGWSDGGIEALLLGMRHPSKVKKIAAMAATLKPGEQAAYTEIVTITKSMMDSMPPSTREIPRGKRELKVTQIMFDEPNIELAALCLLAITIWLAMSTRWTSTTTSPIASCVFSETQRIWFRMTIQTFST